MLLHPVSLRRFPSFRTQPLEHLTPLSMNKWAPEQPSPWRKSSKRESCYGDRVYSPPPPSPWRRGELSMTGNMYCIYIYIYIYVYTYIHTESMETGCTIRKSRSGRDPLADPGLPTDTLILSMFKLRISHYAYAYMYIYIYIYIDKLMYTYICVYIYIHTYTHYVYMYVCMYVGAGRGGAGGRSS